MQVLRSATLASATLALCLGSGCRTAGVGDLSRPGPPLAAANANVTAIVAEHNKNAERIQTIRARPDLTVTLRERGKRDSTHPLSGRLAMEQPRNFKLVLEHTGIGQVGDLGSNDTEYWFWFRDKTQKAIYYCNYDEAEANPQAVSFQPDWIKEAMGLRVISEDEASRISVTTEPGRLIMTHRPHTASGKTYTRITILDRATHRILEHRLYSGDQKMILARAEIPEGYEAYPAEAGGDEMVLVPKRLKLSWVQEGLELDVALRDVKINTSVGRALFVEPSFAGFTRINLAERPLGTATAGAGAGSGTTIRETRPVPPSGIRLSEPTPIEAPESPRGARGNGSANDVPTTPLGLSGEAPAVPSLTTDVVGARYPDAPDPGFSMPDRSSSGWRAAMTPVLAPQ
jgi:hypothetical protein